MDIKKMIQEAEMLQKSLVKAQQELRGIDVTGQAGGGLIEVTMSAQGEIKDLIIKKEAVDPNDVETLEDLILSAFKDATTKAMKISEEKLGKLTGKKGLPPL